MTSTTSESEETALRPYTAEKFIRLVEGAADDRLQAYMEAEAAFLAEEPDASERSFIDMGAGYGRALPTLAPIAGHVTCVEFNPQMFGELERRSALYRNVALVNGDMQELPSLLSAADRFRPVVIILQNTLGTVDGDRSRVLAAMRDVATRHSGSVIVSLFRAGALCNWGVEMYSALSEMVGKPDLERTDCAAGVFVSQSGYTSKWSTDSDVDEIKAFFGGRVLREVREPEFVIFEIGLG